MEIALPKKGIVGAAPTASATEGTRIDRWPHPVANRAVPERGRCGGSTHPLLQRFFAVRPHLIPYLMSLCEEGAACLVGRGRAAHYSPGPALKNVRKKT